MSKKDEFQHYVPSFYLKGFLKADLGKLAVLKKHSMSTQSQPTASLCGEPNFFDLEGVEEFLNSNNMKKVYGKGLSRSLLEDELSKFECRISKILGKIRKNNNFDGLNRNDVILLLEWIAWLYIANPSTKTLLKQKYPLDSNTLLCNGLISLHTKIVPFFRIKTWGIAYSSDVIFTSDRPVITLEKPSKLLDYEELSTSVIIFPISPGLVLIGTHNEARTLLVMKPKFLSPDQTSSINYLVYNNAQNVVLSPSITAIDSFFGKA